MPQRFLRPGITNSERWNAVSWAAQSFYIRILTLVSDHGRFDGRASVLWGHCYAVWNDKNPKKHAVVNLQQVDEMLQQLAAARLINVYEDAETGKRVLQVEQWQERIRPGVKERWPAPPRVAASCSNLLQDSRELLPSSPSSSPVPSPAPSSSANGKAGAAKISNLAEAKRFICEKILVGCDPNRPWSYEAEQGLARQLPIPVDEIEAIAWWRSLPRDDEIPELKFRRDPITETTLMRFWSDELRRALAYRKKTAGPVSRTQKKDPPLWREFFRWKYDDCVLPASFSLLPDSQRREYERDIENFRPANWEEVYRAEYGAAVPLPPTFWELTSSKRSEYPTLALKHGGHLARPESSDRAGAGFAVVPRAADDDLQKSASA